MSPTVILACGALAREVRAVIEANDWQGVRLACLPASLHNRPQRIPAAVAARLETLEVAGERVFVAYADCGTGGELDRVLEAYGAERLPGSHCYDVFAGEAVIAALSAREPGTFYLTDFLARHFDRLVLGELGITRHPELCAAYFGHYRRLVYLSQRDDPVLREKAAGAADRLGLEFEWHRTGYGDLATSLVRFVDAAPAGEVAWPS